MKRACILVRGGAHQQHWGSAFAEGLTRHGWNATLSRYAQPCDMLVTWGVRRVEDIAAQKRRNREVCVLERGYMGDRFAWTSVSFGGELNGRAQFRGVRDDPERFIRNFGQLMEPWRSGGGYALLIGQVATDMAVQHIDIRAWYREMVPALNKLGYRVVFRAHPEAVKRGLVDDVPGVTRSETTLEKALAGAALCVTFNSNTAVEAVLAGVPTVACDVGSMAWDVTARGLEIFRPTRVDWAYRLAWKQFTHEEIASGFCWEVLSGQRAEEMAA